MDFLTAHGADILFYLFAALTIVGGLGVVTLRNPMYGAISLLLCFLAVAALFLLRHAEFLGMVQIFVYGGGIMVLFLFVIMLVNLHRLPEIKLFGGQSPLAGVIAVLLLAFFGYFLIQFQFGPPLAQPEAFVAVEGASLGNSQAVAWNLYTQNLLPFEIASVFLLIAMIGAVVLGRKQ
ncbi:MAG TPA: NADH-quinone oxidoreductase subunit J [Thermoanaerobaculia bacterium]|nr:NADH-quinone oxidoreductase subunit J [Thermoanaerobaculia bacterium]